MRVNDSGTNPPGKLLVCGLVQLSRDSDPVEVRRGMPVLAQDGHEVGAVAAVVLDCRNRKVTDVLFGYVPPTTTYHLVSPDLIGKIDESRLWLRVTIKDLANLPVHRPDS